MPEIDRTNPTEHRKPGKTKLPEGTLDNGPPDYDDDPQGGGGQLPAHKPGGRRGGETPDRNSR
jgi:hypothetical protein